MEKQAELPLEVTKLRKWVVCPYCGTFIEMSGNYRETLDRHLVLVHKLLTADTLGIIARNICYSHEPIGNKILGQEYSYAVCIRGEILPDSGI